ncbi:hypothetical protein CH330_01575 [candidate division WOR-3 bacterium JGI_Cruoil_03_51_56]|uniref:UspA domain-containing protein n=1 Tax=candidate division WOR-3 bacterium JGI_Cruoil_03_51_56 TaxID=1973747 RepID=A0A235BX87_UNCW3|nr:MAG: hypothetical protein CH330_01575 [candidate division WOR-3 bacterium JGI_Cruoil_03_51_56]
MFDRILLFVEDKNTPKETIIWTIALARQLGSRLIAVYIVDTNALPEGKEQLSLIEEKAWKILYEIEDDAFEQNIKVSLLLEQGDPLEKLLTLCKSYEIQLVVLGSKSLPPLKLMERSTIPVVFVNEPRRSND